jgi:hypothetical protein
VTKFAPRGGAGQQRPHPPRRRQPPLGARTAAPAGGADDSPRNSPAPAARAAEARGAGLLVAQLVEPVVVDSEMVRQFVNHGFANLLGEVARVREVLLEGQSI